MYYAHSENKDGVKHKLLDHLTSVANLAKNFAEKFGAGECGYWVGLAHDIGKYSKDFQDYLNRPDDKKKVVHSIAGAIWVLTQWGDPAYMLAYPIACHHSGLKDLPYFKERIFRGSRNGDIEFVDSVAKKQISVMNKKLPLPKFPKYIATNSQAELFTRLLFSALVDADFLDTERHFKSEMSLMRGTQVQLPELLSRFEKNQRELMDGKTGLVNELRREIYNECLKAADLPPGVFRLTVPTGGGKTRSGMAFALNHAIKYGMERIIVAIPYTSIIEQNAEEYRDIFGSDIVLEHHSAVNVPEDEEETGENLRLKLASENWDAPIVVTTTVQLFESLFNNRTSRCRKLHNITRSVIILDEVQTLPVDLLTPILDVLHDLTENYGVSLVLCTATQPALQKGPHIQGFPNIRDIVPNPERFFERLNRVQYELPMRGEKLTWDQVASIMKEYPQCLCVVNTKKDALAVLDAFGENEVLHLSTLLCGAHRRDVIKEVKTRLKNGQPCRLVSTQVIEAGVDLDFPLVLRAVGPLDRIVQAAGRCNREGKLVDKQGRPVKGRVIVFEPLNGSMPQGTYKSATEQATSLLQAEIPDLHDPILYEQYFKLLYQVVETDSLKIQQARDSFLFEEVSSKFKMIRDDTVPVLVRYNAEASELINEITYRGIMTRTLMRRAQPYLISIYRYQVNGFVERGLLHEFLPGLYEWRGSYDIVRGIKDEAIDPGFLMA